MSNVIQNEVLTLIETKLDKSISDLEKISNTVLTGKKNIDKIIDDLEGIKQIIILDDLKRMGGQIKWLDRKEAK